MLVMTAKCTGSDFEFLSSQSLPPFRSREHKNQNEAYCFVNYSLQEYLIRDDHKLILLASLSDSLEFVADSIDK